jgi:WD40 repeat protein
MALAGGEIADTLAFNAQGTRLAVRSRDLTASSIWDVATGTNVLTLRDSAHGFNALAFSPDPEGRWLASGGLDSTVKVWDARTGICLHTFRGHQDKVRRLQFVRLPEGLHLVSASSDQTVKFWPLASLEAAAGTPNR